ncbi:MAG: efflux RND transporter periplasmic adaptor subunit [Pseudomonadota bacterium]|nr:efflux RND transporter periplasmic adaptor subunit [Pseudomonadota bacterium]
MRGWLGIGAGLAAVTLAGCNAPQVAKRPPLPVRVVTAKVTDYAPTLSLTGEIAARVSSDLSFRVSGRVIERKVDVGAHVQAGEALARIDPASAQSDLDAANAAVASAEAVLKQNSAAYERQKQLLDAGFTTRSGFDSAQQNLRTAQGALDAAKAQAATAADALTYTVLRAEKAGVVTARQIEVGQIALAAQTAFTVAQDGPRDAVFNVFESIFFARPAGGGVKLALVSDPNVTAIGHVREVSPTVNPKSGTVTVKVGVEGDPDKMPLGAPVIGRANFAARKVVELPWTAAASDAGALAVWVLDPASGAVAMKPVTAEAFDNETLILSAGLQGGEEVVTAGGKFLYPGEIVAPQERP